MATAREALKIARTLLNDDNASIWPDSTLMPKLGQAHKELQSKVALNGLSVVRDYSAEVTIAAGATSMGISLPTNIVTPAKMDEKAVGEDDSRFVRMTRQDYVPEIDLTDTLRYWVWENNTIKFLGANTARVVKLFYTGTLTTPTVVTDDLGLTFAELFVGPRVAALAAMSVKDYDFAQYADGIAEVNLSQVVRTLVKGDEQPLPVRRRPFSFRLRRGKRLFA